MPAPVAAFSGTPLTGVVPKTVTFTDASTNTPTSWAWDFGDTGTSTAQSPTHEYVQSGTYTVTLTATNVSGSDDEVKVGYVVVTGTALTLVMDGIAALITAGGVIDNVYAFPSKSLVTPCAVVGYPTSVVFDLTFQGAASQQDHNTFLIPVWFLVADAASRDARDRLSNFLTGAASIKNLLDGNKTYGVTRVIEAEVEQVAAGAITYLGVRFDTETET